MKDKVTQYTSVFDQYLSKVLEKLDSKFNVEEREKEFVLTLPLAGYTKKDTKVSFNNRSRVLTVVADTATLGRQEHVITLGEEYNVSSLVANMSNGLLIIKISKSGVSIVKDIEIK